MSEKILQAKIFWNRRKYYICSQILRKWDLILKNVSDIQEAKDYHEMH